jgi:hypothetical protein
MARLFKKAHHLSLVCLNESAWFASNQYAQFPFSMELQSYWDNRMKKQVTLQIVWCVCAVYIGLGALFQSHAQAVSGTQLAAEDRDSHVKWIIPEAPPLPPVYQDGQWITWEKAFGPLPPLPPIRVVVSANSKQSIPVDPQKQWVEIKRKLAPSMTDEQLRAEPPSSPHLETAKRRAMTGPGFVPKVTQKQLAAEETKLGAAKAKNDQISRAVGNQLKSGIETDGAGNPTLHLAKVEFKSGGYTEYEVWVTDAPTDQWYEIYYADEMLSILILKGT